MVKLMENPVDSGSAAASSPPWSQCLLVENSDGGGYNNVINNPFGMVCIILYQLSMVMTCDDWGMVYFFSDISSLKIVGNAPFA